MKPAHSLAATNRLHADVLVGAKAPKLPPLQGDGPGLQTVVPAVTIRAPKLPPFQGD